MWPRVLRCGLPLIVWMVTASAYATETLMIATSPSVAPAVEALGRQFETAHPDVRVRL